MKTTLPGLSADIYGMSQVLFSYMLHEIYSTIQIQLLYLDSDIG